MPQINPLPIPEVSLTGYTRAAIDETITGAWSFDDLLTAALAEITNAWNQTITVDLTDYDVSGEPFKLGGVPDDLAAFGTTAYVFDNGAGVFAHTLSVGYHENLTQEILALFGDDEAIGPLIFFTRFSGVDAPGPSVTVSAASFNLKNYYTFGTETGGTFTTRKPIDLRAAASVRGGVNDLDNSTIDFVLEGYSPDGLAALRLDDLNGPIMLRGTSIGGDENYLRFGRSPDYALSSINEDGRICYNYGGVNYIGAAFTHADDYGSLGILRRVQSDYIGSDMLTLMSDGSGSHGVSLRDQWNGYEFTLSEADGVAILTAFLQASNGAFFGGLVSTSTGFQYANQQGLSANASGTQAGGTLISGDLAVFTTVGGAGYSATLSGYGNQRIVVFNRGANALNVYPPLNYQIDALGLNNPYSIAAGSQREFFLSDGTSTPIRSR